MKITTTCCIVYIAMAMLTSGIVFSLASWFAPPINVYVQRMRLIGPCLFAGGCVVILFLCLCCFCHQHDFLPHCDVSFTRKSRDFVASSDSEGEESDSPNVQAHQGISLDCPQCRQFLAQNANDSNSQKMSNSRNADAALPTRNTNDSFPVWERKHSQAAKGAECEYPLYSCSCGQCRRNDAWQEGQHPTQRQDSQQTNTRDTTLSESQDTQGLINVSHSFDAKHLRKAVLNERSFVTDSNADQDVNSASRVRPLSFYAPAPVTLAEHLSRSRSFTQLQAPIVDFDAVVYPLTVLRHVDAPPLVSPIGPQKFLLPNSNAQRVTKLVNPSTVYGMNPHSDDGQYFEASV